MLVRLKRSPWLLPGPSPASASRLTRTLCVRPQIRARFDFRESGPVDSVRPELIELVGIELVDGHLSDP